MNDLSVCGEACNCVNCRVTKVPVEPPKYMFKDKPVKSDTWLHGYLCHIHAACHQPEVLAMYQTLLVEPDTGDYCYVYWDEADQCSNPYPTFDEAAKACEAYIAHL